MDEIFGLPGIQADGIRARESSKWLVFGFCRLNSAVLPHV